MINNWAQQGGDLGVCLTLKLITGQSACDAGDEVGDLYARFSAGIDEPDIGQLTAGMACGVRSRDVGYAFGCQCGLLVVHHGDRLGVRAPMADGSVQRRKQRLHQRCQLEVLQMRSPCSFGDGPGRAQ